MAFDGPVNRNSSGFQWFLTIFSILLFTVAVINVVEYVKIVNKDDPDSEVSASTAQTYLALNIVILVLSFFFMVYEVILLTLGKSFFTGIGMGAFTDYQCGLFETDCIDNKAGRNTSD
jgi:hypothetical protein